MMPLAVVDHQAPVPQKYSFDSFEGISSRHGPPWQGLGPRPS